jgi:hypothetical protein
MRVSRRMPGASPLCRGELGSLPKKVYPIYTHFLKRGAKPAKVNQTKVRAARVIGGPFYD